MSLTPRDYRAPHSALAGEIVTMITNHPDAFAVLLYRADQTSPETVAVNEDVVGALDTHERSLQYAGPEECMAMMVPDLSPLPMFLDGIGADGAHAQPLTLLLSVRNVPEQSVIQWWEYTGTEDTLREVSVYVEHSEQVGVAPGVCVKLYCLPMQDFGDLQ